MAEPPIRKKESTPEGRGCLYISLAVILVAVLAFAIAAWVSAPSSSPSPISGATPPSAPAP